MTLAAGILVLFIVCFTGAVYYVASQKVGGEKTYFRMLGFTLDPGKSWRVGLPIVTEGKLVVTYSSDGPVRIWLGNAKITLVDQLTVGNQRFVFHVDRSADIIDILVQNPHKDVKIVIANLTCILEY